MSNEQPTSNGEVFSGKCERWKTKEIEAIHRCGVESHSHNGMMLSCVCVSLSKQEQLVTKRKISFGSSLSFTFRKAAPSSQQATKRIVHLSHPIRMKIEKAAETGEYENHLDGALSETAGPVEETFRIRPESFAHNKVIVLTF